MISHGINKGTPSEMRDVTIPDTTAPRKQDNTCLFILFFPFVTKSTGSIVARDKQGCVNPVDRSTAKERGERTDEHLLAPPVGGTGELTTRHGSERHV
jgi:hypothetical protein